MVVNPKVLYTSDTGIELRSEIILAGGGVMKVSALKFSVMAESSAQQHILPALLYWSV